MITIPRSIDTVHLRLVEFTQRKGQKVTARDIATAHLAIAAIGHLRELADRNLDTHSDVLRSSVHRGVQLDAVRAMLAEIKSRMLLPRSQEDEEDEEDPRAQLIRRLQEYERYREVAERVDALPRLYRDLYQAHAQSPELERTMPRPEMDLQEVLLAFAEVLRRADLNESHHIQRQSLSTRERMSQILLRVSAEHFTPMLSLLMKDEGRLGVVVTFLAIMELIKESLVELAQNEPFGPIHIKARAA
jgi:segregation and condensation protein A